MMDKVDDDDNYDKIKASYPLDYNLIQAFISLL